ncbi:ATP-binding protein [Azospirillum doebereinerae]|uniref:Adenylyl cyclase n=1 Tax=Azospirillum doebereinerae TaxID=92933 RepID=A0A433JCK7_9PROT|nr:adenylate/guanylate cyclase domain-containing protein [Azospirillum doebereinerae]RUQ74472.1 adenylyl cyclase [Azospirillum doebereinerae]
MGSIGGVPPPDSMRPARAKTPERKVLTMMFVDIVSSSALVAGRDPEDADQILLPILQTLVQAVPRYGGMVAQLLGDGFMAVFGAPDAKEDHALRACLAAQDIVRTTVESDLPDFQIRIGISSGEVVAHVVESGFWADYRMVGECVHAAAKLQQRADPNTAQFSRDTLDLIPVGVVARPVGSLTLAKGVPPIPAFTLEGARAVRRTATDLLLSADAPFVGRVAEAATLFAMADQAEAGTPSLLLLRGEAGIGKSRLVGEFFRDPRSRRWNVLPWPQMPIRRLGDPDDLEAVALSLAVQLTGSAEGAGPSRIADAAGRRAGALAADAVRGLFGLPAVDPLWSGLDPAQRLSLTIDGLVGAVLELASSGGFDGRPMLVLVEDAHWARPLMVRLLDALAAALRGSGARLLLVATMRPPALRLESAPEGWSGPQGARRIDLDTLDTGQVQSFLDYWLGSDWSLAELKAQVTERSQGVPLYLEEILRTLEGSGAITGAPGAYRLANPAALPPVPRSLHGLLAARIDLLEAEPRRVLLHAAVVGPTFDVGLLRALSSASGDSLPAQLAYLERAGFILRARLLPNLEYGFHHALIREVAYATQTKADRKGLHGRLLMALRQRRDHDLPNRIDLMAHHAFMAENWPAAYACGRKAGRRAESRSKLEDATRHYRNSLQSVQATAASRRNASRQVDLLIALPRTLLPRGGTDVHDFLNLARSLAEESGDSIRSARASSMLASFRWAYGELDEGLELCLQGLNALEALDSRETRVQLLFRLGGILADKGYFKRALDTLDSGSALIDATLARSHCGLATLATVHPWSVGARSLAELGRGTEAVAAGIRAVEIAEESGHAFSRIFANAHLGWTCLILGEIDRAISPLQEALSLCGAARAPLWHPLIAAGLGYARVMQKRHAEGFSLFEDSFATFRRQAGKDGRFHPRVSLPPVLLWQAKALDSTGRHGEALDAARHALEASVATGQRAYEAHAGFFLADATLRRPAASGAGRTDGTELLKRAETLARQLSMAPLIDACGRRLATVA